jgi:hypothetical protein
LRVGQLGHPPRSLAQTEISRFIANCPELAGFRVCASSLQNQTGKTVGHARSKRLPNPHLRYAL